MGNICKCNGQKNEKQEGKQVKNQNNQNSAQDSQHKNPEIMEKKTQQQDFLHSQGNLQSTDIQKPKTKDQIRNEQNQQQQHQQSKYGNEQQYFNYQFSEIQNNSQESKTQTIISQINQSNQTQVQADKWSSLIKQIDDHIINKVGDINSSNKSQSSSSGTNNQVNLLVDQHIGQQQELINSPETNNQDNLFVDQKIGQQKQLTNNPQTNNQVNLFVVQHIGQQQQLTNNPQTNNQDNLFVVQQIEQQQQLDQNINQNKFYNTNQNLLSTAYKSTGLKK